MEMKLKSSFEQQELTQEQIDWLNQVVHGTWEYENGEINVVGAVDMDNDDLKSIPVQFGYVTGYFDCGYSSNITSLKGCPREVGGHFFCNHTNITSLQYAPKEVGGDFSCSFTKITSLQYAPREVGDRFNCSYTEITSLQYAPREIGGSFYCVNTNITSLQYAPRVVGGSFFCKETKIKGKPDTTHIRIGGELFWKWN